MIEDADVDDCERVAQAAGDQFVGLGRLRDAARMVVGVMWLGLFCGRLA